MSPVASSSAPPPPQSSALPPTHQASEPHHSDVPECADSNQPPSDTSKVIPFRKPLIRLELRDLSSSGSRTFLRLVHASVALQDAVDTVLKLLYKGLHVSCIPPTRSVTLVIRDMEGVAYTTGLNIDQDHKEIHLSTNYIEFVPETRQKEEIIGVLVHEMVHCWQHSGLGKAPQGLIEGVADWVRLKAGSAPPHWKRHFDCDWDVGYERTGYFLEWLEKEHGDDIVQRLNEAMRDCEYDADKVWHGCCGQGVEKLWEEYKRNVEDDCGKEKMKEAPNEKAEIPEAGPSYSTEDRPETQEDRRTEREKAR